MKFGKQLQTTAYTEWAQHYMSYKVLKKVINSLECHVATNSYAITVAAHPPRFGSSPQTTHESATVVESEKALALDDQARPSMTENGAINLQAQKASFFYRLERELEKVNRFYLSKEAEIKVRLRTLLDKKRIIKEGLVRVSNIRSLTEAFALLMQDLLKLQNFVEINATGFLKILKKWDKRSKSSAKEVYLLRRIEIQPCFNRDALTEITDVVASNVSELTQLQESTDYTTQSPVGNVNSIGITSRNARDMGLPMSTIADTEQQLTLDDLESELIKCIANSLTTRLARILERRAKIPQFRDVISRVFVRACGQSSLECVTMLLNSGQVDITYADEINNRICIHETAIFGNCAVMKLCVAHGALKETADAYGRVPLHYVAMHGSADCMQYLLEQNCKVHILDHDGFTPLIYAVIGGRTQCVAYLLETSEGFNEQPHHALSLAAQHGHLGIAKLLLSKGAPLAPVDGLHPLHLTARQGHAEMCRLLTAHGADVDVSDKYYNWTPLFYAASEGHVECVKVLLDAGATVDILDETGWQPIVHALYRGHIDIAALLTAQLSSSSNVIKNGSAIIQSDHGDRVQSQEQWKGLSLLSKLDQQQPYEAPKQIVPIAPSELFFSVTHSEIEMLDVDLDAIPSLSLPPPIIPFRIYGHNYLDKKCQIQISLRSGMNRPSINMFGVHKLSSLKVQIQSKPDTGSIPYSIILPADDVRKIFTFQVEKVDIFSLQFDIFPTYGTKAVGRAVALSSVFLNDDEQQPQHHHHHSQCSSTRVISDGHISIPLFDMFKVIGEITFDVNIITPFSHPRLEVGGQVETYWKTTKVISTPVPRSVVTAVTPSDPHTTIASSMPQNAQLSAHSSLSHSPLLTQANHPVLSSFVTASSLAEEYIHVVVQITRDHVPVIYPSWYLPLSAADVDVSSVSFRQFIAMGTQANRTPADTRTLRTTSTELARTLQHSFMSLEEALKTLPSSIGILLEIKYPSYAERAALHLKPAVNTNTAVDLILKTVYDHIHLLPDNNCKQQRSLVFSSFNPNVCTAVNWKQPNYAVFFSTHAGYGQSLSTAGYINSGLNIVEGDNKLQDPKAQSLTIVERDSRCRSIKEAIRFAKTNNLLGLLCEAAPLIQAPDLINTVKESGLVLATFGKTNETWRNVEMQEGYNVDATYLDGVLRYSAKSRI